MVWWKFEASFVQQKRTKFEKRTVTKDRLLWGNCEVTFPFW